jgi:hypothetical protein
MEDSGIKKRKRVNNKLFFRVLLIDWMLFPSLRSWRLCVTLNLQIFLFQKPKRIYVQLLQS